MKRLLLALLAGAANVAAAQPPTGSIPGPTDDPMVAAMMAQAAKPGDDALSCDQLAAEIASIGTDPEVQSVIQEQGAFAQGQMAKMEGAQASKPAVAGQVIMGIVNTFMPNPVTGYAQQAAAAAQGAQASVEAQKNMQEMMANAQRLMAIMPQLMRGARVAELAKAKSCDFMAEPAAAQ